MLHQMRVLDFSLFIKTFLWVIFTRRGENNPQKQKSVECVNPKTKAGVARNRYWLRAAPEHIK